MPVVASGGFGGDSILLPETMPISGRLRAAEGHSDYQAQDDGRVFVVCSILAPYQ